MTDRPIDEPSADDDPSALDERAKRLPYGAERAELHRRAVELADAAGDIDHAFRLRLALCSSATHGGDPMTAIVCMAWLRAHADADPARFAKHEHTLDWDQKWVASSALSYPQVPLEQIEEQIDDLERRHVAAGSGTRQALELRQLMLRHTGDRAALAETFRAWLATARTGLSDCPACEHESQARTLLALGRDDEALAALDPLVSGEVKPCSVGPGQPMAVALPLLVEAGRHEEARRCLAVALRDSVGRAHRVGLVLCLAALMSRVGRVGDAIDLAIGHLPHLVDMQSPSDELWACSHLVQVLSAAERAGLAPPPLTRRLPTWLQADGGEPPADYGRMAAAAREHTLLLASRFDTRNGTTAATDRALATMSSADLSPIDDDPPDVLVDTSGVDGTGSGVGRPTRVTPTGEATTPPPDEPDAMDGWARALVGRWRLDALEQLATVAHDETQSPERRAIAAAWVVRTDAEAEALAGELSRDPGLPTLVRVRLGAAVARVRVERRADDADDAIAHMIDLAGSTSQDSTERLLSLEVLALAAGRASEPGPIELAAQDLIAFDDAGQTWWRRMGRASSIAVAIRRLRDLRDDGLADSATDVITTIERLADDVDATPAASASALADAAALAHASRAPGDARRLGDRAISAAGPDAPAGFLMPLLLLLSDAAAAARDRSGALAYQRRAIDAARQMGQPFPIGWARRGLAHLLRDGGRLDEAVVAFAEAARCLLDAGAAPEAWPLQLEQARLELQLNDVARARNTAGLVLEATAEAAGTPGASGSARIAALRRDAFELRALSAGRQGDHRGAAGAWEQAAAAAVASGGVGASYRSAGAVSLATAGDKDAAEAEFAAALAMVDRAADADPADRSWHAGTVHQRRAVARAEAGDLAGGGDDASAAVACFREGGFPNRAASAGRLLGRVLADRGDGALALAACDAALADLAAGQPDDALQAALEELHSRLSL